MTSMKKIVIKIRLRLGIIKKLTCYSIFFFFFTVAVNKEAVKLVQKSDETKRNETNLHGAQRKKEDKRKKIKEENAESKEETKILKRIKITEK